MSDMTSKVSDAISDTTITAKIKAQFVADDLVSVFDISVKTENNGDVTLTGKVSNDEVANRAISIAKGTAGVKFVHNKLTNDSSHNNHN